MVQNFYALGPKHAEFVVRIGVQGKGVSPHYKLEASVPVYLNDKPAGVQQDTFEVYSGMNHKKMTAFEIAAIRDEHWSSKVMTFPELQEHFKALRTRPSKV